MTRAMFDTETGSDIATLGDGHQDLRVSLRENPDDVVALGTLFFYRVTNLELSVKREMRSVSHVKSLAA